MNKRTNKSGKADLLRGQFDSLATEYDAIKEKNQYYLETLKRVFIERIREDNSRVIEVGCGTGEILNEINPKFGVGVDISEGMIRIARSKFPQFSFYCQPLEKLQVDGKFDYIILPDILEYVPDLDQAFLQLQKLCKASTIIIISSPNPFWEFALKMAERLNLKMQDRLSQKPSKKEVILAGRRNGFMLLEQTTRLLVPIKTFFSGNINQAFFKLPLVQDFGFIQVFVWKRA